MHEAIITPTPSSAPSQAADAAALETAATRAGSWAGEPFLHPGEDPATALAPGTARRAALDDALTELDAGAKAPSAALARPLRADARSRARACVRDADDAQRNGSAAPPGRCARGDAGRADRDQPGAGDGERQRNGMSSRSRSTAIRSRRTRRTISTRVSSRRTSRRSRVTTRAQFGGSGSVTRPPRARRSPRRASSRRRRPSGS